LLHTTGRSRDPSLPAAAAQRPKVVKLDELLKTLKAEVEEAGLLCNARGSLRRRPVH
jgi:hypothetical protein